MVLVEEVQVVAGNGNALLVVGHPEADEDTGRSPEGLFRLLLGGLGQRPVGGFLSCGNAGRHAGEASADPDPIEQVLARHTGVDPCQQFGTGRRRVHIECDVGLERGDRCERRQLMQICDPGLPAREQVEAHALVHDHLTVEVVERAHAEIPVLQQLRNGDGPVVDAIEERRHRRRLVQGVRLRRIVMDLVRALPVGQHGPCPAPESHRGRLGRCQCFMLRRPSVIEI